MTSELLVSIVTPSYNQAHFLEATIRSVLEQDYPHIEYIICDGGSTDGSVDIIRKYAARLAWWCSEKDGGQSAAINKGWRRANGLLWSYLNSDDLLLPGAVNAVVEAFKKHPESGIIHGDWTYIDQAGHTTGQGYGASCNFQRLLNRGQDPYVAQPASFYKADLIQRVGWLDENLHLSMDYDLLLRLAQSAPMLYLPRSLASFRVHTLAKTSSSADRHWQESFLVQRRYGGRYLVIPRLKYWRYRSLAMMPHGLQRFIRRWRNSVNDRAYLLAYSKHSKQESSE